MYRIDHIQEDMSPYILRVCGYPKATAEGVKPQTRRKLGLISSEWVWSI